MFIPIKNKRIIKNEPQRTSRTRTSCYVERIIAERQHDPAFATEALRQGAVDAVFPMEAPIAEGAPVPYALLGIPRAAGSGNGYLLLGRHPETGYFVAGVDSDMGQLAKGPSELRLLGRSPLEMGSEPGTILTLGRGEFMFGTTQHPPAPVPGQYGKTIRDAFGPETSRQHVTVEIIPEGVRITDTSQNGTLVQRRIQPLPATGTPLAQ